MYQSRKSREHLKNTSYQEDKCEWKPLPAHIKSQCRELLLGNISHIPYLTPQPKASSRASKIKYQQSLLELAPDTLAAGEEARMCQA